METRVLLQEEANVKCLRERRDRTKKARHTAASSFPARLKNSKVCSKVAEFACSACFLCVCCPLSIAWCCIKLPCKIGWRAARRATHWACYGSNQKIVAAYSSFSDIDSDSMPCKSHTCSKELSPPIQRIG